MPTRDALVNAKLGMQEEIPPLGDLFGQGFIKPIPLMSQQWQPGLQSYGPGLGTAAPAPAPSITAWHGTPHTFAPEEGAPLGRFRNSQIGTGEGAQGFGYGHYLAQRREVAEEYRKGLSGVQETPEQAAKNILDNNGGNYANAVEMATDALTGLKKALPRATDVHAKWQGAIDLLKSGTDLSGVTMPGSLYEARINADPASFLDLNAPFSQQSKAVQDFLAAQGVAGPNSIYEQSSATTKDPSGDIAMARMKGTSQEKAAALQQAGIPGIKYLDEGSRAAGQGTRNFVVFDPKIIDIINKYGIAGALGMGLISQEQAQLAQQQGLGATDQTTDQRDRLTRAAMGF